MSKRQYRPRSFICQYKLEDGRNCGRGFLNRSGLTQHVNAKHRAFATITANPDRRKGSDDVNIINANWDNDDLMESGPAAPEETAEDDIPPARCTIEKHPLLDGTPCNNLGQDLPADAPPSVTDHHASFAPFLDRADFELAEFLYTRNQTPATQIDALMDIWASKSGDHNPPFVDHKDLYHTIDSIPLGDVTWKALSVSYCGEIPAGMDVPPWFTSEYEVWYRDPLAVLENQLANPDFTGKFHISPYREYNENGERVWSDVMSANWAWKQADAIAEDPSTHGSMFVPVILGSDKTTVSVATGQNEYYPLYISIGNVQNSVRRAHKNAVSLLAFLAIPKTDRKHTNDDHWRQFRRQLFHSSIQAICESLRPTMLEPCVTKCPDGHFRRVIYGLGPYIADYPEQCILASIVGDWCPRCTGTPDDLDGPSLPRTTAYTAMLSDCLDLETLWTDYGIVGDVKPFTTFFPRASIYELITSDLLHQVIKGTFKDHLVTWVGEWLELEHGKTQADAIMADIDRRIAAVPSFPGLRRFPEGRGFKQWTGDDSKALMKVYLPAISEHVPEQMVKCLAAFLDFCYLVRRSTHTESMLNEIDNALTRFHRDRVIFKTLGVRKEGRVRKVGLSIPRQHSLVHYKETIQLFGSPNGLCSSITESMHIKAVKDPWRRTNKYHPLGQMLLINQRLAKLAAFRSYLEKHHMLDGPLLPADTRETIGGNTGQDDDHQIVHGPSRQVDHEVNLAMTRARGYPHRVHQLAECLNILNLPRLVGKFLHIQLFPNSDVSPDDLTLNELPAADPRSFHIYHSAVAEFYAPSDCSGDGGRRRERIRATPTWHNNSSRRDCVFVSKDPTAQGMASMEAARTVFFVSFTYNKQVFPCALVEWFTTRQRPCPRTGMWIVDRDYERDGTRSMELIHIDSVIRGAHLIPVFGQGFVPMDLTYHNSLDRYDTFYVNQFADHNSFDLLYR
ncbi:hypothetical protein F5887DRAFT_1063400 [Amanita rubescens]|nr:hypothetical protein F5887DRAFT_1065674 [Amanita rubescens]KAF8326161.1 hypothetical protein F5887DRAFT_1065131 [Amanita rubescens]KAF8335141.1 hypothetical protein F5887DRAFT_1063400 [Amanita rubescens]